MKLKRVGYCSAALEWEMSPVDFSDLTLLVGVSGVGKTQILNAILSLKRIAAGRPRNGASWSVAFTTADGSDFAWTGQYELDDRFQDPTFDYPEDDESPKKDRPKILTEMLTRGGEVIVERTSDNMLLCGNPTPKLSPSASALSILSEEDAVSPASRAFNRIVQSDVAQRGYRILEFTQFQKFATKFATLEDVKESDQDPHIKLAIVYLQFRDVFQVIKERFIGIFPHVMDLRVEPIEEEDAPFFMSQTPTVQIREKGVCKWINQYKISSGMLRTLFHISQLYLWPKGTVILIDEFENSLGVNCIDVVTEDLLAHEHDLQFIITSHHPYIINNVGPQYWKVVRRNGGKVYTQNATELGLSESSHQAFIQLINRDEYRNGIEEE